MATYSRLWHAWGCRSIAWGVREGRDSNGRTTTVIVQGIKDRCAGGEMCSNA